MQPALYALARAGLAAKGSNYLLIGIVAAVAVVKAGHHAAGRSGAWRSLAEQPFGRVLMLVLALGFLCYAAWRVLSGAMDLEKHGRKPGAVLVRFVNVMAGLSYVALGISALRFAALGTPPQGDNAQARSVASTLLDQPLGMFLVGAVALGFVIGGIVLLVVAARASFTRRLDFSQMSERERTFAVRAGRLGTVTFACLCFMTAAFFFFAAVTHDSREAKGLGGALRTLAEQPFGPWLILAVALGFFAHGAYQFVEMRYLRRDFCQ